MPAGSVAHLSSPSLRLPPELASEVDALVARGLAEDVGSGDVTTLALISPTLRYRAELLLKASGVVAGLPVAARVFQTLDAEVAFETAAADGDVLSPADGSIRLAEIHGPARA